MADLPLSLSQDLLNRKQIALGYIKQGASTDPLTLSRFLGIANTWPDMKPGTALSFAQAGFDRSSPETAVAANLSTKQAMNQQRWVAQLKSMKNVSDFKNLQPGAKQLFDTLPSKTQHAVVKQLANTSLNGNDNFGLDDITAALGRLSHGDLGGAITGGNTIQPTAPLDTAVPGGADFNTALKGVSREAANVANTPLQLAQGGIRAAAANVEKAAQGHPDFTFFAGDPKGQAGIAQATDVGQQITQGLQGKNPFASGDGYLPSPTSPISEGQAAAARAQGANINGSAFTLGRGVAQLGVVTNLYQPDSPAYGIISGIVDAGAAFKLDPASQILTGIGDDRQAAKTFAPEVDATSATAGGASGATSTAQNVRTIATGLTPTSAGPRLNQMTKTNYLNGQDFADTYGKVRTASMDANGNVSPSKMMRVLNASSPINPKVPVVTVDGQPLITDLANAAQADDIDSFRNSLASATQVQSPLDPPGVTYKIRQGTDYRALAAMPTGSIADPADKTAGWNIMDNILRGSGLSQAERDPILDKYIATQDPITSLDYVTDAISAQIKKFNPNMTDEQIHQIATFFPDAQKHMVSYDIDQLTGHERLGSGIAISGTGHVIPAPLLDNEGLNSAVAIPDMRTIRRLTTPLAPITGTVPWRVTQTALAAPSQVWKPLQVLSARMGVKIFGDAQANLAARGFINAFTSPVNFLGLVISGNYDNKLGALLGKLPGAHAVDLMGPDGVALNDEVSHFTMNSGDFIWKPDNISTFGWNPVSATTHPDRGYGLAEKLARMHSDPIMRGVAMADDPAAAKDWFWDGEGAVHRLNRAPNATNTDQYFMQKALADPSVQYPDPIGDIANDRAAADKYIDTRFYPQFQDYTAGSDELKEAVRTGKLGGASIYNNPGGRSDLTIIDQQAADRAKALLDEGYGPQHTIAVRAVASQTAKQTLGAAGKKAIDFLFHGLVDVPDHVLNRNPAYIQNAWANTEELLPHIEPGADYDRLMGIAEKAKLPPDQLARIKAIPLDTSDAPKLGFDDFQKLVKTNALDDSRVMVHDLTSKSQFFDAYRGLIPFGDAFRLVVARWAKLLADEPQIARRAQQGLEALQAPGSGVINRAAGDPVPVGQPFFHKDPQTGQDVFTLPGSSFLSKSLLSVVGAPPIPIPLQGQVSGLNMIGAGYPGLGGPALTLPAKWLLPDIPAGNAIKDVLFPNGGGDSQGVGTDIANTFMPSWLSKVADGPPNQQAMASAVHAAMQTLASTGNYQTNTSDPARNKAETQRLANDAKQDARWMYVIRGIAQFTTPGSPAPESVVQDKSGKYIDAQVLGTAFRNEQNKVGGDKALDWLIANYGTKNIFAAQGASRPTGYGAPTDQNAVDWSTQHPNLANDYPLVYGLFAPPGGAFNADAYAKQFTNGERTALTAKEQIAAAENKMGFLAYDNVKAKIVSQNNGQPPDKNQQSWLAQYRSQLEDDFPGFDSYNADPYDTQKKRTEAIKQLTAAASDPAIQNTDAGAGVTQYLQFRTNAIAEAKRVGLASPFAAKAAQPLRDWLRQAAQQITHDHPGFGPIWQQLLSHELTGG